VSLFVPLATDSAEGGLSGHLDAFGWTRTPSPGMNARSDAIDALFMGFGGSSADSDRRDSVITSSTFRGFGGDRVASI
jgi:hypothetical protein